MSSEHFVSQHFDQRSIFNVLHGRKDKAISPNYCLLSK